MRFTDMIPRTFAAAATLFLIVAYGSSPVVRPDGAVWILESMYGKPPIENTFLTLEVNADSFSGSAGCNRYGGRSEGGTSIAGGRRSILDSADREYCHGLSACCHH